MRITKGARDKHFWPVCPQELAPASPRIRPLNLSQCNWMDLQKRKQNALRDVIELRDYKAGEEVATYLL